MFIFFWIDTDQPFNKSKTNVEMVAIFYFFWITPKQPFNQSNFSKLKWWPYWLSELLQCNHSVNQKLQWWNGHHLDFFNLISKYFNGEMVAILTFFWISTMQPFNQSINQKLQHWNGGHIDFDAKRIMNIIINCLNTTIMLG